MPSKITANPRLTVAFIAMIFAGGVNACVGGASIAPTQDVSTTASPTAAASDCISVSGNYEPGNRTTFTMASKAVLITVGTMEGFGSPAWNTPDGHRPTLGFVQSGAPVTIWRPLKTKTESSLKGDGKNVTRAVARGGVIGCDVYDYGDPVPQEGQRYVFFFYDVSQSDGKVRGDLILGDAWPVSPDGTVTRPAEFPISLQDLQVEINNPVGPTFTPYPTATPVESGPG
jgi:hypothetical protein